MGGVGSPGAGVNPSLVGDSLGDRRRQTFEIRLDAIGQVDQQAGACELRQGIVRELTHIRHGSVGLTHIAGEQTLRQDIAATRRPLGGRLLVRELDRGVAGIGLLEALESVLVQAVVAPGGKREGRGNGCARRARLDQRYWRARRERQAGAERRRLPQELSSFHRMSSLYYDDTATLRGENDFQAGQAVIMPMWLPRNLPPMNVLL